MPNPKYSGKLQYVRIWQILGWFLERFTCVEREEEQSVKNEFKSPAYGVKLIYEEVDEHRHRNQKNNSLADHPEVQQLGLKQKKLMNDEIYLNVFFLNKEYILELKYFLKIL